MPIRKYMFWGLTVVLIFAFANLMIRGRRLEKEQAQEMVETVEEAKSSPTRVLNPADLKITLSKMEPQPDTGQEKSSAIARHEVEIINSGTVAYKGIQLRFAYIGRDGEKLETKTHFIDKPIQAGATLRLSDISIDRIPSGAIKLDTTIAYADMGSPNPAVE